MYIRYLLSLFVHVGQKSHISESINNFWIFL